MMTQCECGWPIYSRTSVTVVCPSCKRTVAIAGTSQTIAEPIEPPADPTWVSAIRRLRKPGDTGVGDTVARLLGRFGERFKAWSQKLGIPCGCTARQAEWNRRWPYEKAP